MADDSGSTRSLRNLVVTLRAAVVLVWRAAPRRCAAVIALQLVSAALLGAQVLVGREALAGVLGADQAAVDVRHAILPLAALAAITAAASLCTPVLALQNRLLGEFAQRAAYDRILDVTATVDLQRFDDPAFFDHLQRVQSSAVARPLLIAQGLMQLLGGCAGIAGLTLALLALQPMLVPLLLITGLPLMLVSRRSGQAEFAFAVGQSPAARLRLHLCAVLLGRAEAREVRAFALQEPLRTRYRQVCDRYLSDLRHLAGRRYRQAMLAGVITTVATAATLSVLLLALVDHRITLADAGAAVLAVRLLGTRMDVTFAALGSLYESALFLADLRRFGDLAPAPGDRPVLAAPAGFDELRVRDLRFRYPGGSRPALDGIDLTVRRGEVIGLVGENGSGKSTLAMVLAGLLAPASGSVTWDGVDLAGYDRESVRRHIALVFPDAIRYAMSASDNISLGYADERTAVIKSARAAGAHDLVAGLPDGYDTFLSSEYAGGQDLSDGQWQRIALARAFHRDATLVVLDEPATGLDPRAQHELFEAIHALFAGRTVVVISHRLADVRTADRIIVLAGGRVAEQGDHDSLVAAGRRYANLFALQAEGYVGHA
jgi:ATP-binding cassette subfamily B protein